LVSFGQLAVLRHLIEQVIDELPEDAASASKVSDATDAAKPGDWQKICFYITPIGATRGRKIRALRLVGGS
jgi:hypothetical protein